MFKQLKKDDLKNDSYYYVISKNSLKHKIIDFCYFNNDKLISTLNKNEVSYCDEIFVLPQKKPGEYYERICLPTFSNSCLGVIFNNNKIEISLKINNLGRYDLYAKFYQYHSHNIDLKRRVLLLISRFYEISNYIEPNPANDESYSFKIRELIILICTEIESVFKNILISNNVIKKNYNTFDYFKLKAILKLDEYDSVNLLYFSNCLLNNPFKNWIKIEPTNSLAFYKAYNSIKHNSEKELNQANMLNLKNALSSLIILYTAQTGLIISDDIKILILPKFSIEEWYIDGKLRFDENKIIGEGWEVKNLKLEDNTEEKTNKNIAK